VGVSTSILTLCSLCSIFPMAISFFECCCLTLTAVLLDRRCRTRLNRSRGQCDFVPWRSRFMQEDLQICPQCVSTYFNQFDQDHILAAITSSIRPSAQRNSTSEDLSTTRHEATTRVAQSQDARRRAWANRSDHLDIHCHHAMPPTIMLSTVSKQDLVVSTSV
jgi:hypothetical protein